MYEGHRWRERRQLEYYAQLASWVTAPHFKRPIDPRKLLQEEKTKKKTTPEKTQRVLEDLEDLLGVG
jgi:hypothetical protein